MSTIATSPIEIREDGVAWIIETNTKAIEVALDHLAHGWSPEEVYFQHYGQLSLAQIQASLAYYYELKPNLIPKSKPSWMRSRSLENKLVNRRAESGFAHLASCLEYQTLHGCPRSFYAISLGLRLRGVDLLTASEGATINLDCQCQQANSS